MTRESLTERVSYDKFFSKTVGSLPLERPRTETRIKVRSGNYGSELSLR